MCSGFVVVLAVCLLLPSPSSAGVGKCKNTGLERCNCGLSVYDKTQQYVVECTDTGFTDTTMLQYLPNETQVLVFTGNNISQLPWNVFGTLNTLNNLSVIDMSNNNIHEIKGKAYHHVTNVKRLILNHNNISISSRENNLHPRLFSNFVNLMELHLTNAFVDNGDSLLAENLHEIFSNSNLSRLYKLHLEQNEIRAFHDPEAFCDLASLRDLYLGDNRIGRLSLNLLCLRRLRFLDLERNNLSAVPEEVLRQFDRVAASHEALVVDLSDNPLRCGPDARRLYQWLQRTRVTVRNRDLLQCTQQKYGSKYVVNLHQMYQGKHERLSKAVTVMVVVLTLALGSLLAMLAYVKRDKLKARLQPLLARKVHYTTIESQQDV